MISNSTMPAVPYIEAIFPDTSHATSIAKPTAKPTDATQATDAPEKQQPTKEPTQVNATTVQIMKDELKRVEEYVSQQGQQGLQGLQKQTDFEFTEAFTNEVTKYGKYGKAKKKGKKKPYDKAPKEYKNGMSNFVAFTSHFLPYFEGTTNKHFRNLLWDVYKGVVNTWFEHHALSKEKAKELGREKYIEQLRKAAPEFGKDFPNIVAKLTLFDASLSSDEHRVKVLQEQVKEKTSGGGVKSSCIGAMNASPPM